MGLSRHRTHFVCEHSLVAPFCVMVDRLAASIIAIAIVAGVQFHN